MFSDSQKQCLLDIARRSVAQGVENGHPLSIKLADYDAQLQSPGASFVTLQINHQLRGCIGSLEAFRPLVEDVAENAFAAAFRDPRFAPLEAHELAQLHYHISVLAKPETVSFNSEAELLSLIRPGTDGLILEDRGYRGTFLPSVWESLPNAADFLAHLKQKAGLPADYWSDTIRIQRYTVEDIE